MKAILYVFLVLALTSGHCAGDMREFLDGMEQMMSGQPEYDQAYFNELVDCFQSADPEFVAVHDIMWDSTVEYANANEENKKWDEHWMTCDEVPDNFTQEYFDKNCTVQVQPSGNLSILEPCNYASNLAYYKVSTEICANREWGFLDGYYEALIKASSYLAYGSSLFHASQTSLGHLFDVKNMDLLFSTIYQAGTARLRPFASPVITDLSLNARNLTALAANDKFQDIVLQKPVDQWEEEIAAVADEVPNFALALCASVVSVTSLSYNDSVVDQILNTALDIFGDSYPDLVFCAEEFTPALRDILVDVEIDEEIAESALKRALSAFVKLGYAAIWQESLLPDNELIFTHFVNKLGSDLIPQVNAFSNNISGIVHNNQDFQDGINVYPGDFWCNEYIPHAKWHLEAAIGILDVIFAMQNVDQIIKKVLENEPKFFNYLILQ